MSRNLLVEDELNDFAGSVRDAIAATCPLAHVRSVTDAGGTDEALWRRWAEHSGLQGLMIGEKFGGAGAGVREAAAAVAELGAGLVPGPVVMTMLAGLALELTGAAVGEELAALSDGTATAAIALPATHEVLMTNGRLTGRIHRVHDGVSTDVAVLLAIDAGDPVLLLVGPEASDLAGWVATPVESLDQTRRFWSVELTDVPARVLPLGTAEAARLEAAVVTLASAAQLGLMRRSLDETVSYCAERTAFGRVVGSFQAVKHQLAELACVVAQADALVADAVAAADGSALDALTAAEAAWCYAGPSGTTVVSECLRLHGGIGYTWEHDAHLYFRRSRSDELSLGPLVAHRRRLADLLGLSS